jgi:hypothetical protein
VVQPHKNSDAGSNYATLIQATDRPFSPFDRLVPYIFTPRSASNFYPADIFLFMNAKKFVFGGIFAGFVLLILMMVSGFS